MIIILRKRRYRTRSNRPPVKQTVSDYLTLICGLQKYNNFEKYTTQKRKIMKKILQNIGYCIIVIIVAPAAIIHIAYQHWYFKHHILDSMARAKLEKGYNQ